MKFLAIVVIALLVSTHLVQAQPNPASDSQLKVAIEKHTWYSGRHGYRFLSNGVIAVDGYPTEERWSIQNGLLHREWGDGQSGTTKILAITDRQFVEQEVSGQSKGAITMMSSGDPNR